MPTLIEKATGKRWEIPASDLAAAEASGLYEPLDGSTTVTVVDPESGLSGDVAVRDLEVYEDQGYRPEADSEFRSRENETRIEREHGGFLGALGAGAGAAVDTALLGIPGAITKAVAPDFYEDVIQEGQEAHPGATLGGEVLGVVGPVLATGGASLGAKAATSGAAAVAERGAVRGILAATPAGQVAKLGNTIRATGEGAGLAGRVAAGVGAGVAEGGIYGAGSAIQELTKSDDPLSVERIASVFGSNIVEGIALGGALGAGGELVASGAGAARKTLGKAAESIKKSRAASEIPEELLTPEGLAAAKQSAVAELQAYNQTLKDSDVWLAMGKSSELTKAKNLVDRQLGNLKGLAENPAKAIDALQRQNQNLTKALEEGADVLAKLAEEDRALASVLNKQVSSLADDVDVIAIKGKTAQRYSTNVLGKARAANAAPLEISIDEATGLVRALEAGEMQGARAKALGRVPEILDLNSTLEKRLIQLRDAGDAIKNPPKRGVVQETLGGVGAAMGTSMAFGLLPGGIVGAAGAVLAPKAVGWIAKRGVAALSEASLRSAGALDAFFNPVRQAVTGSAIPLATKTLQSVKYSDSVKHTAPPKNASALVASFKERAKELQSTVEVGPDGALRMSMAARQQVAQKLQPLHTISPQLADRAETFIARKHAFLASKLPRRPGYETLQIGPDNWQPSSLEIRRFARYAAAAESAQEIEERLARGVLSVEDAETYRELFPEHLAQLKMDIALRLPELKASLPFERKMALSILTGVHLVPALNPRIMAILQRQYSEEPNTEGGTQAPQAQPAFGSVSKEIATPAQLRSNPARTA